MTLGLGSLTSELDRKETAFQSLPQSELMRKRQVVRGAGLPPSLTEALVAEKVLNDKAAAANAMTASMQSDPRTVAQQNEVEIRRQAEMEVAKAVGQANANKMQRQQKNMQKLASMDPRRLQRKGLAAAPVQQKQFSAQGGIVGYKRGRTVEEEDDLQVEATNFDTPDLSIGEIRRGAKNRPNKEEVGIVSLDTPNATPPRMIPRNIRRPDEEDITEAPVSPASLPTTDETERFATARPKTKPKAGPMQFSQAARDKALERLLYITGARGGLGSRSREAREFDVQEAELKLKEDEIKVKNEITKLTKSQLNFEKLQARLLDVNQEISRLVESLRYSPEGVKLEAAKKEQQENPSSENAELLSLARKEFMLRLDRESDPYGTDAGVFAQQKVIKEALDNYFSTTDQDLTGFTSKRIR